MQMFYFLFKAPSLNLRKKRTGNEYNLHLKPTTLERLVRGGATNLKDCAQGTTKPVVCI